MPTNFQFSDFDIDFNKNDFINDVSMKYDKNSIRQSIMNIILTRKGEKPFNRGFGVGLHDYLFESYSPAMNAKLELDIIQEVRAREPRADIETVVLSDGLDSNTLELIVTYIVFGGSTANPTRESLRLEISRIR